MPQNKTFCYHIILSTNTNLYVGKHVHVRKSHTSTKVNHSAILLSDFAIKHGFSIINNKEYDHKPLKCPNKPRALPFGFDVSLENRLIDD